MCKNLCKMMSVPHACLFKYAEQDSCSYAQQDKVWQKPRWQKPRGPISESIILS